MQPPGGGIRISGGDRSERDLNGLIKITPVILNDHENSFFECKWAQNNK